MQTIQYSLTTLFSGNKGKKKSLVHGFTVSVPQHAEPHPGCYYIMVQAIVSSKKSIKKVIIYTIIYQTPVLLVQVLKPSSQILCYSVSLQN